MSDLSILDGISLDFTNINFSKGALSQEVFCSVSFPSLRPGLSKIQAASSHGPWMIDQSEANSEALN